MKRLVAAVFLMATATLPTFGQQASSPKKPAISAVIKKVIADCVLYVRNMPDPNPAYGDSYKHFDAYYNAATGKVEDNGFMNVDQQAKYVFRQCMAEHNVPLN